MGTTARKTRQFSKDQVRAWLATVIAPMASALAVEEARTTQGNWSFRCHSQDFEFLWPIRKMVAAPYLPNLEQLLRYRDDVKTLAQGHDGALDKLRIAARTAYDRILRDERFRTLAASTAAAETEHKYFAEYVVNGLRDLAPHYSHHDVWNREGAQFLGLRETPQLTSAFRSLDEVGRRFATSARSLVSAVNALQVKLADTYKLPPIDPVDAVRV